jgi:hypothetical protein
VETLEKGDELEGGAMRQGILSKGEEEEGSLSVETLEKGDGLG